MNSIVQAVLDRGVLAQEIDSPCEGGGGGFVAGDEDRHGLVDEGGFGKSI